MKELESIRSSYKPYRKEIDNAVNLPTYLDIANGFMKFLMEKVFDGNEVPLPAKLGSLLIQGKYVKFRTDEEGIRKNSLPVDWKETKDLWAKCEECKEKKQLIYHLNEHTDGIRYKFKWRYVHSRNRNVYLYVLVMSRANKRKLAKKIKEGIEYFIY